MTLEEAIRHAEEKAKCGGRCGMEHEQLAMWLKELQKLRAAEPEKRTEEHTETHACDCISRAAAIDVLFDFAGCIVDTPNGDYQKAYRAYRNRLETLPSAQPDIIACGDCIHWICHDRRCGYWNHGVKPLDWCCHAERRTDENNNE